MPIPPPDNPLTEQDVVDTLFNNFQKLQNAQCEFEELWYGTDQGERLPDERQIKALLQTIRSRAELLDFGYTALRAMRQLAD